MPKGEMGMVSADWSQIDPRSFCEIVTWQYELSLTVTLESFKDKANNYLGELGANE